MDSKITSHPCKSANENTPSKLSSMERNEDYYQIFRRYLILGRLLGVVPIQNVFQPDVGKLFIRKTSCSYIYSLIAIILLSLYSLSYLVVAVQLQTSSFTNLILNITGFIYIMYGVLGYTYFLWNAKAFIRVFQNWNQQSLSFFKKDVKLERDIAIICGVLFTSGILENMFADILRFTGRTGSSGHAQILNATLNHSALENYYYEQGRQYANIIPYNPMLAIIVFLSDKYVLYTWHYLDILIILLSRTLSHQFKSLTKLGNEKVRQDLNNPLLWRKLMADYDQLFIVLKEFTHLLSPLIFLSYFASTFFSCVQFYNLFTHTEASASYRIYAAWAIIQLTVKTVSVSISAANLAESIQGILDVFYNCPSDCYIPTIRRFERRIQSGNAGFHGLGCFRITKSLILQQFYYILTLGILLAVNPK